MQDAVCNFIYSESVFNRFTVIKHFFQNVFDARTFMFIKF